MVFDASQGILRMISSRYLPVFPGIINSCEVVDEWLECSLTRIKTEGLSVIIDFKF